MMPFQNFRLNVEKFIGSFSDVTSWCDFLIRLIIAIGVVENQLVFLQISILIH